MFPRIKGERGKDSVAFSLKMLKEIQVSATPGASFGPSGESHIRLSFCVPEQMINMIKNENLS